MNPVKILSVDDEMDLELLLTQYFRRQIRKGEYEFFFAHNGLEALTLMLKEKDINIILSDINMPEMDGLTLLTKINEMQNPAMKCIMVSAYGDMGNIRSAMNNGAFDFATKPIDLDDLSITIEKAIEQINYIKMSQQEHVQLVRIDEDHIGIVMADVSGKGIPAAIFMAVSRTLIRTIGLQGFTPGECLTKSNDLLSKESVDCMFVTVFYAIYNVKTGEMEYSNGGHNSPVIIKADGRVEMLPTSTSCMVGPTSRLLQEMLRKATTSRC